MRGLIFSSWICLLFMHEGYAQDSADYILVKRNIFIDEYVKREGTIYPTINEARMLGKPSIMHQQSEAQMLFKTPGQTYIYNISTGRIYRLEARTDSTYRFNRTDHTYASFYNIGALLFTIGEDIYNLGGYGFWKTSGSLRRFNFKDKEWDIVPLSREIVPQFFPGMAVWVNSDTRKVYAPFQRIVNEGVWGEGSVGKVLKEAWVLDLPSSTWNKVGKVTDEFLKMNMDWDGGYKDYQDPSGVLTFQDRKLQWIDYNQNRILTMDDPLDVQTIERFGGNSRNFRYLYKGFLYVYNPENSRYDSLKLDLNLFKGPSFRIWEPDYSSYYPYAVVLVVGTGLLMLWSRWKKSGSAPLTLKTAEKINVELDLTEMEAALLQLLVQKADRNEFSTIDEMNYVLGLKDKNLGIQKKVRSDLINGLNQKYSLVMKDDEHLIESVRSEVDKRYFEYFIAKRKLPVIKEILQTKNMAQPESEA